MAVAGVMQHSTGVNVLLQGGIAFLLDAMGENTNIRMFRVQAAGSPYCMEPRKPKSGRGRASFSGSRATNMNRGFSLPPVRSTHGQFESGQATVRGAATTAVSED
jgi:hypothetical protein